MRVLFLLSTLEGKGTYWRALNLSRSLAKKGHEFAILAISRDRRLRLDIRPDVHTGVLLVGTPDLLWGPLRSGWDPWDTITRIVWGSNRNFDLVHAIESRPTTIVPALYWQRLRRVPLVMDWCDWFGRGGSVEERPNVLVRTLLRPVETFFEEHFRTWADGTIVINNVLREKAIELGVPPSEILYMPDGSKVEELQPIPQDDARGALGLSRDVPIIGYIGAIFHRDAKLMAGAFERIRQAEPKAQLLLAGYCNVAVEDLVVDRQAVHRTGRISFEEINLYLAACDVCWLPMRDTGANRGRYPLKVKDYMAVGKPVVATDVGEVADLIRRGGFGLLAADQADDLADQVVALLHDPCLREAMGQRARKLAETEFTWDQIADRLERYYWHVLETN